MVIPRPQAGVVDDADRGTTDAALCGLIQGFFRVVAENRDHFGHLATLSPCHAEFAQDKILTNDDPVKRNRRAILGKVVAEVDAQVEELVARLQGRARRGVQAFDQAFRHMGTDEGQPEFEDHGYSLFDPFGLFAGANRIDCRARMNLFLIEADY